MERAAGILLAISSLPSPYGIGTLGKAAYDFADFLAAAGQKYWQMLPVGPISYRDSPYQSFSTFAGNPYFIDLDLLEKDSLLTAEEISACFWGNDPRRVDYGAIYQGRFALLEKAFRRGWNRDAKEVAAFAEKNADWLPDYALFMALKRHFAMRPWTRWPEAIRLRRPLAVAHWRRQLEWEISFFIYLQFLFQKQWDALKTYVNKKGVELIGDLPIYVAIDSADVWASPENYQLDAENVPTVVAGVPPDGFTPDGQLWGNPIYDWDKMKADGFSWWERRMRAVLSRFDVVRIDHFRGLESYWSVPCGAATAAPGHWEKGPGLAFVEMLRRAFPDAFLIAEDLGYITPEVRALLDASGYPGMKVLEFAFDDREAGDYLPHKYPENCVCYAGTHDNNTVLGWLAEVAPDSAVTAKRYLGLNKEEGMNWGLIRGGMCSPARLFVAQMQDYLGLDASARMNTPGKAEGNWQWRLLAGEAAPALAEKIRALTVLFGRC